jgi:7-cyano-7-deazaguanine synthase in queuosine biosynthesis
MLPLKKVAVAWSGGIDSTAVLANLLSRGYECIAVTSDLYASRALQYATREAEARNQLFPHLQAIAEAHDGKLELEQLSSEFLWNFAHGNEIPMRNKRWIDLIMARVVMPRGLMNLAMGEYVGVDTWLVRDHVPQLDCDHRALSAYMLSEYGIKYRLISLQDFGESRYKSDRLRIGYNVLAEMGLTTNCMRDSLYDCGTCYKCVERAAAFYVCGIDDPTDYERWPQDDPGFAFYVKQMRGEEVTLPHASFSR